MHILVLGTGVIGTTYAWQLEQAGHAITLFVRPERKDAILQQGYLSNGQYLFGLSRVVGGWRTDAGIEALIFNSPQLPKTVLQNGGYSRKA